MANESDHETVGAKGMLDGDAVVNNESKGEVDENDATESVVAILTEENIVADCVAEEWRQCR